jgi:hypothetical protein
VDPAWSNPADIDVVLLCSWTPTIHRVKEIVPERRAVRFFSAHNRAVDFWERNFRYYLSNVFEALDQPGEWYLDRRTGALYYYPLPGEELAEVEVVAPVMRSRLVMFEPDFENGKAIEHLYFRGLAFRHVDGDADKHNGVYRQGHMYLAAAVAAKGLRHASFERCEFSQLGEYALELADGCRDVAVRQCHFRDLGAGALQLGVTDLQTLLEGRPLTSDPNPRAVDGLVIDNNPPPRHGLARLLRHRQPLRLEHAHHAQRDFRRPLGRDRPRRPLGVERREVFARQRGGLQSSAPSRPALPHRRRGRLPVRPARHAHPPQSHPRHRRLSLHLRLRGHLPRRAVARRARREQPRLQR